MPVPRQFLAWCAFIVILQAAVMAVDVFVIGQRWRDPLKPYHLALYPPIVLLLILGAWVIERRHRKPRQG